jgi:UDP-N-acetylmuramate--alanine ligase
VTRYHVVGIGGAGMSAIARVLLARGHAVSGSDTGPWPLAEALARDGATVHDTFAAAHATGADIVIRSSAYKEDNVEVAAARERGIPVWKRDEAWREVTRGQRVVAIAGTHGKSTTTAMTWSALRAGGIDASLICGAVLHDLGTNAHAGAADVFVIEADEYDNAFLALRPEVAVITTLDHDHVDLFPTPESYRDAFRSFVGGVNPGGTLIASADDEGARGLASWARAKNAIGVVTYGRDASATNTLRGVGERAYELSAPHVRFELRIPGWHNALNATAALLPRSLTWRMGSRGSPGWAGASSRSARPARYASSTTTPTTRARSPSDSTRTGTTRWSSSSRTRRAGSPRSSTTS